MRIEYLEEDEKEKNDHRRRRKLMLLDRCPPQEREREKDWDEISMIPRIQNGSDFVTALPPVLYHAQFDP